MTSNAGDKDPHHDHIITVKLLATLDGFTFENYADQSLDRRQKLIGMQLGTKFFFME